MTTTGIGANVLITGSNRGIGLGLVNKLAKQSDIKRIFAGCRNPEKANDLKSLQNEHSTIKIIQLDVQNDSSIKSAFEAVNSELGPNAKLNLLINNAGILESDGVSTQEPNREVILHHFNVNTVGMVMVTAAFLPLLRRAAEFNEFSRIINVSSDSGSCTYINGSGISFGNIAYSMTKTAVNSYTRMLAGDEENICSIALDPGWIQTDMGGSSAPLTVDQATGSIVKLISKLTKKDSGSYLNRNGSTVPF